METLNTKQLLLKIDQLEKRVLHLEAALSSRPSRKNATISNKMIEGCYQAARKAYENEKFSLSRLADEVANKYGMKNSTASLTIQGAYALLQGELFKSAISGKSATLFLESIYQDYGAAQLRKALFALRLHISHRRSANHNVDLLESICDKYESTLR